MLVKAVVTYAHFLLKTPFSWSGLSLSSLNLRRSSRGCFQAGVARSLCVSCLSPPFPLLKLWETSVGMTETLAVLVSTWQGVGIESLRTAGSYAEAKPRDPETVTAAYPCTF